MSENSGDHATAFRPSYLKLLDTGEFARRIELAKMQLQNCVLCGWNCAIDRNSTQGPCRSGIELKISSAYIHFGEERPLVGVGGSGAIFFTGCDLRCQFCQTFRWNVQGQGYTVTPGHLAEIMLNFQERGAVNINLVTPTHMLPGALQAILLAAQRGLQLPVLWNSGGYDSLSALTLLDGIVDLYMPDMKYSDPQLGLRLSTVHNYPVRNREAVLEMYRQVAHFTIDGDGVARRGVIVRHLVMPGYAENTRGVLEWLAMNLGADTYLSLMDQYRPAYRAHTRKELSCPISSDEYAQAYKLAISLGFRRLDDSLLNEMASNDKAVN
jgi:putative pyruvate formate lyase activating enzyme